MEEVVQPSTGHTRKKKKTPEKWTRKKSQLARHSAKGLPGFPTCNHNGGKFKCTTVPLQDIRRFHQNFYSQKDKVYQDNFILKFTSSVEVKRRRPTSGRYKRQPVRTKYFIGSKDKSMVPVCLNTFIRVLNVSRFRINGVLNRFRETGQLSKENRGGDRVSTKNLPKKENVMNFINKFKCSEPHYCAKHTGRKYLSAELNIKKMWKMYNRSLTEGQSGLKVTQWYFRSIFNKTYNLGFGSPRVDVCSTCLQLDERLKHAGPGEEKQQIITEKRVHKLRAKAFYTSLKCTDPKIVTFSYDCQKNLPLPKVPDQAAYYSRQIYLHNFTVVKGDSKSQLTPENVTAYIWTENEFGKGSNEIASLVFDTLIATEMESPITTVRLVCDGCGGQNKNSIVLAMACHWLSKLAPKNVRTVELYFPITGHSFLPPDRVFGVIEKSIRKKEVIYKPSEYIDIISEHAKVVKVGIDCQVFDWKKEKETFMKKPAQFHFQLGACRRIVLTRTKAKDVRVRGEYTYNSDLGVSKSLTKPGKLLSNMSPNVIPASNTTKETKKVDVNNLLTKHYGDHWRDNEELLFYKNIIDGADDTEEEEPVCEPTEEPSLDAHAPTLYRSSGRRIDIREPLEFPSWEESWFHGAERRLMVVGGKHPDFEYITSPGRGKNV
ncbi:uncharacterized protein [Anabrus simplex]|uniref:uncharacterized protein n=1 Tax=Anabrus simplex TaxID=316456 RepID=UPI0035A2B2C5